MKSKMKVTRSIWTGSILVMTASIVLLGGCIGETQSSQESVYSNGRTDGPILSVKSPSEDIEESVPSTSVDIGWGEIRMRGFTDHTELRQLTSANGRQGHHSWNHDGTRIVYEQEGDIYIITLDSGEIRYITSGYNPVFSPDGSEVFFLKRGELATYKPSPVNGVEAMAVTIDGLSTRSLGILEDTPVAIPGSVISTNGKKERTPLPGYVVWSPSRERVALYVEIDVDPGSEVNEQMRLAIWEIESNSLKIIADIGSDSHPSWSPDDTSLAVAGWIDDNSFRSDLWVINADTGETERLTQTESITERMPRWSPDGSKIAFLSWGDSKPSSGLLTIYEDKIWTMNPDGSDKQLLITRPQPWGQFLFERQFTWNPDSSSIGLVMWNLRAESESQIQLGLDVWDIEVQGINWDRLLSIPVGNQWIGDICWSPDGERMALEWYPNGLEIWDVAGGMAVIGQELYRTDQHIYLLQLPY